MKTILLIAVALGIGISPQARAGGRNCAIIQMELNIKEALKKGDLEGAQKAASNGINMIQEWLQDPEFEKEHGSFFRKRVLVPLKKIANAPSVAKAKHPYRLVAAAALEFMGRLLKDDGCSVEGGECQDSNPTVIEQGASETESSGSGSEATH